MLTLSSNFNTWRFTTILSSVLFWWRTYIHSPSCQSRFWPCEIKWKSGHECEISTTFTSHHTSTRSVVTVSCQHRNEHTIAYTDCKPSSSYLSSTQHCLYYPNHGFLVSRQIAPSTFFAKRGTATMRTTALPSRIHGDYATRIKSSATTLSISQHTRKATEF